MFSLLLIFKEEYKNMYPRWISPLIHISIVSINLLFYWYLSKAIDAKPEYSDLIGGNYFWYIIVGELSLSLPINFLSKPPLILKQLYLRNLLDEFLMLKNRLLTYVTHVSVCQTFLEMSKYIIYLGLLSYSGSIQKLSFIYSIVLLQLLYIPLFLSFGYLACCIVIYFGRGEKIVQIMVSILFVLGGAYFPVEVLPLNIGKLLSYSPINRLVSDTRALFNGKNILDLISTYHVLVLTSGLILSSVIFYCFKYVITNTDRPLSHKPYINSL